MRIAPLSIVSWLLLGKWSTPALQASLGGTLLSHYLLQYFALAFKLHCVLSLVAFLFAGLSQHHLGLFLVAAAAYLLCSFLYPMPRYPFFRWALLFRYGRVVLLAQGLCVRSCNMPNQAFNATVMCRRISQAPRAAR